MVDQTGHQARAGQSSKTIRLPVHLVEKIARMRRERMRLLDEFGREPTDAEFGQALGQAPRKVALMRCVAKRPSSLDAPLSAESITSLGELVPDEEAVIPDRELVDNNMSTLLHALIRLLLDNEVEILTRRFGLDGNETATLEEIGKQFGVTRERVRQLQNTALAKLRQTIDELEKAPQ